MRQLLPFVGLFLFDDYLNYSLEFEQLCIHNLLSTFLKLVLFASLMTTVPASSKTFRFSSSNKAISLTLLSEAAKSSSKCLTLLLFFLILPIGTYLWPLTQNILNQNLWCPYRKKKHTISITRKTPTRWLSVNKCIVYIIEAR